MGEKAANKDCTQARVVELWISREVEAAQYPFEEVVGAGHHQLGGFFAVEEEEQANSRCFFVVGEEAQMTAVHRVKREEECQTVACSFHRQAHAEEVMGEVEPAWNRHMHQGL